MRNLILFILAILCFNLYGQQELQMSNDRFTMINFNPASAGIFLEEEVVGSTYLSYRNQWLGYEGAPQSYLLSSDYLFEDYNFGVGLSMYSDNIGVDDKLEVAGNYAYQIQFDEGFLSLGLRTAFSSFGSDFSLIRNVEQGDIYDQGSNRFSIFSVGAGAYYFSETLRLGISMPSMFVTSNEEFKNFKQRHIYFHSSFKLGDPGDFIRFEPRFLFKYERSVPIQAKLGLIAWINDSLSPGLHYRWDDALAFSLGWLFNEQIQLGIAYDMTLSDIRKISDNTIEFQVGWLLK